MRYVERDENGTVTGLFARPQPGRAEELLADDHPDIVAFHNRPEPPAALTAEELARALIDKGTLTQADIDAVKQARG